VAPVENEPVENKALVPVQDDDGYDMYSLQQAWKHDKIARFHRVMHSRSRRTQGFQFLFPTLFCQECCFSTLDQLIPVGDSNYVHANENTTRWYDGDFISAFASLAGHFVHKHAFQVNAMVAVDRPMLLHVTYPNQMIESNTARTFHHIPSGLLPLCIIAPTTQ